MQARLEKKPEARKEIICPSHTASQWHKQKRPNHHHRAGSSSTWGSQLMLPGGHRPPAGHPAASRQPGVITQRDLTKVRTTSHVHTHTQLSWQDRAQKPIRQAGSERSPGCLCPAAFQKETTQCSTITALQEGFRNMHQESSIHFLKARWDHEVTTSHRWEATTFHPIVALLNPGTSAWLKPIL